MPAQYIVFFAHLISNFQTVVVCATHGPMMQASLFNEGARVPPFHSSGQNCDDINPAALHRNIAADRLKTVPAKQLASPRYVFHAGKAEVISRTALLHKRRTCHPQAG